nr:M56 family metallopeptidase [bacterium]
MKLRDNIYLADHIKTPFVFGIWRPRVYVPSDIGNDGLDFVLAHEQMHIRRKDHLIKSLAFIISALHWFNPLVWFAYRQLTEAIEMACDEAVIRRFSDDMRSAYAEILLSLTIKRKLDGAALAFGESPTRRRVRNIMGYRRHTSLGVCAALLAVAIFGVFVLLGPAENGKQWRLSFPAYEVASRLNFETFDLQVTLPTGWVAKIPDERQSVFYGEFGTPLALYEGNNQVGTIFFGCYQPYDGVAPDGDYYKVVYPALRLPSHYYWDICATPVRSDSTQGLQQTALARVYKTSEEQNTALAPGEVVEMLGIVSFDDRKHAYVGIELDPEWVTEKQRLAIAEEMRFLP